jgi:hypothetical protein
VTFYLWRPGWNGPDLVAFINRDPTFPADAIVRAKAHTFSQSGMVRA